MTLSNLVKYCTLCGEQGHTARHCARFPSLPSCYQVRCPYCNTLTNETESHCKHCKRSLDEVK